MSKKYVIEIKPEYEDSFKGVMILGAKDSNLFVDTLAVDNLEELNSDYINEHFGSLQQDAYDKGYKDGRNVTETQAHDAAYQRGLEDGKWKAEDGCTGCMWEGNPYDACEQCCNAYKNLWTAKDDKIEVGDEVRRKSAPENERGGIVTKAWENSYFIMWTDGSSGQWDKDRVVKTGRHFNISSILKEMQS